MAKQNSYLTILQWNANSVLPRKAELLNLIQQHDPTLILLQETQLIKNKSFKIPNYHIVRRDRPPPNKGGGSLIAIKSQIPFSPITIPDHLEHTAISIPLQPSSTNGNQPPTLQVYNIYNPPNSIIDLFFINLTANEQVIIAGDFNAHHTQWSAITNDRNGKYLAQFIENHDLALTNVKTNTFTKGLYSTLIDLTIIPTSLLLSTTSYVKSSTHGSDHFPIITQVNSASHLEPEYTETYNFNKANFQSYKHLLDVAFINPPTLTSAIDQYNFFVDQLNQAAIATIPLKTTNPKHKRVPYWNNNCKEAVRQRNTACNKYKKNQIYFRRHRL